MLLLLLASASLQTSAEAGGSVAVAIPATTTVRIVRAAELRVDHIAATDESLIRTTQVRDPDGSLRNASLIEFY